MADIEVIFDPAKEMAAIVNLDTRQGWGPAMIGDSAGVILQAFVDSVPFDITAMDAATCADAFVSFLDRIGAATAEPAPAAPAGPVEPSNGSGLAEGRLQDRVAAEAGAEPPDPQPADTDAEAAEGPPLTVVRCYNCNGEGSIEFGDGSPPQRCGMCNGTGKLEMPVAT